MSLLADNTAFETVEHSSTLQLDHINRSDVVRQ